MSDSQIWRRERLWMVFSAKKKGSNDDWTHPHDPDARITKMKDGRTYLAHKAERAVDMETGAIVAVTLRGADVGDTATILAVIAGLGGSRNLARDLTPIRRRYDTSR